VSKLAYPDPPLRAQRILLRPWTSADVPAIVAACQDPTIPAYIPHIRSPYSEADARVIDRADGGREDEEEIAGPGGLLAQLTKRLVERAMEVELTDHLGYEPHQEPPGGAGNSATGRRRRR
jgi:RimJ/RimL family protein N-acetyltransferase